MTQLSADQLMQRHFGMRDWPRAKQLAEAVLATDPRHAVALRILGEITLTQGLLDQAWDCATRAVQEQPDDVQSVLLAARVAQARGDTPATVQWCDRAMTLRPNDPNIIVLKASALERGGDIDTAEALLKPLIATGNPPPAAANVWAQCLVRRGDGPGAVSAIDAGLALFPPFAPPPGPVKARMLFIKAKALDKMKRYDEAFQTAILAKQAAAAPFDPAAYIAQVDERIAFATRERMNSFARATPTATRHIFIAGMPRSGTTLVEQILDAHPDAAGVGEAKEIDIMASRLPGLLGSALPYPQCLADMTPAAADGLRAEYEAAMVRHGFGPAGVLVNKNLENYQHLGLIALLFPDARIIVTRRDPRDIAVSCMMSNFKAEKMPYLSSLEHIALAWKQWERLIAHWRSVLDLPFMDIVYEDLVRDQDAQTRALLQFAGLSWDDRAARFWQSGRTVMTLSYDQVSRPMYDSSIGRWKHYERHLGPFVAAMNTGP